MRMPSYVLLLLVALLLSQPVLLPSQDLHYRDSTMIIPSDILQEDRTIQIFASAKKETPRLRLYVLDGEWNHDLAKGIVGQFVRWGRTPDIEVVSLTNTNRTRDFTPTEDDQRYPGSGGAATFLQFVQEELQPAVEDALGAADYEMLFGHSFGGLFALYTLKTAPATFDAYMAASPSIWWKDDYLYGTYALDNLTAKPFLYLSAGTDDRGNTAALQKYGQWLAEEGLIKQLDLSYSIFNGENHFTNVTTTLHQGLLALFPDTRWSQEAIASLEDGGMRSFHEWHTTTDSIYGIRYQVPVDALLAKAYNLHQERQSTLGISLLKWLQQNDQTNYQIPYYLGAIYADLAYPTAAVQAYQQALGRGGMPDRMRTVIERNLSGLEADIPRRHFFSTDDVETSVAFTPDGERAYVSRHAGQWGRRENPPAKIHEYVLISGKWQHRGLASFSEADTPDSDGNVFISHDGQYLFFTSSRTYSGKSDGNPDIWRVPRTGDGWGTPELIAAVNSPGYEASPVTDAAGNLYFSSMREGGQGLGDLYVARLVDGEYQSPELLPGAVNSADGEWNLLVDPDGQWLIVETSKQEGGLSPYGDLYLSRKEGDKWGTPESLKQINTTGSDLNPRLMPGGNELLFISSQFLSSPDADVYVFPLEQLGL